MVCSARRIQASGERYLISLTAKQRRKPAPSYLASVDKRELSAGLSTAKKQQEKGQ